MSTDSRYLRVAALGDSTTVGVGDPVPGGWRGWARLLVAALGGSYDVSFHNGAACGATAASVRATQLADAVAHRPDVATLVVGVNDTMRSGWDAGRLRDDLMASADALHAVGATIVTVRYHDHASLLGLPGPLRRPLSARLEAVNRAYDDVHAGYGGLRLDLASRPEIRDRSSWSVDRFHPSELGHRALARAVGTVLVDDGLDFELPSFAPDGGLPPNWRRDALWLVGEGAPWMGRRARDLGPWAVRAAWQRRPSRAAARDATRAVDRVEA